MSFVSEQPGLIIALSVSGLQDPFFAFAVKIFGDRRRNLEILAKT
jgi:hypothetical protein